MGLSDPTTLESARLQQAQVEAPVARAALTSSVSLKPPAMPPSAILLVRDMADPLPGRITSGFTRAAEAGGRADWERAAQDLGYERQALLGIGLLLRQALTRLEKR
jgi:hypothetical protein